MSTRTSYHMGVTKDFMLMAIMQQGTEALEHFEGTKDEALAAIRADSRTTFTMGKCDNQDELGRCQGHKPTLHVDIMVGTTQERAWMKNQGVIADKEADDVEDEDLYGKKVAGYLPAERAVFCEEYWHLMFISGAPEYVELDPPPYRLVKYKIEEIEEW